jgi:hypothetical protein
MNSSTSEPLCSILPGSPFCSGCDIKNNGPNTDTGPEEPDLTQYEGFYADVSSIGSLTLNNFANMSLKEFKEIGYEEKTVIKEFTELQNEILNLFSKLEA